MMKLLDENRIIWKFTKGAPELYILCIIIYQILNPTMAGLKTFLLMIAIGRANTILKYLIFKPLYKFTGKDELPIIGKGSRPDGASGCSSLAKDVLGKKSSGKSKSFGMPSGHSQIAWTLTVFITLQLLDKGNEMSVKNATIGKEHSLHNARYTLLKFAYKAKYEIIALLTVYSLLVSFSRVYVEGCHTIEQVILGALFGTLFAYIAYYIVHKYIQ